HLVSASASTSIFPVAALLVARGLRNDARWRAFYPRCLRLAIVLAAAMPIVFAIGMLYPQFFGFVQKIYAVLALSWLMATAFALKRTTGTTLTRNGGPKS